MVGEGGMNGAPPQEKTHKFRLKGFFYLLVLTYIGDLNDIISPLSSFVSYGHRYQTQNYYYIA